MSKQLPSDHAQQLIKLFSSFPELCLSALANKIEFDLLTAAVAPAKPSVVLLPIIDRGNELTVLFTERAWQLSSHPGQISFPGGTLTEQDQTFTSAALRETEEEIGLKPSNITILGKLNNIYTRTNFLITPIVGLIQPPFALALNSAEVSSVFEAPLRFLLDPQHHTTLPHLGKDNNQPVYQIKYQDKTIWGATAGIIVTLSQQLAIKISY